MLWMNFVSETTKILVIKWEGYNMPINDRWLTKSRAYPGSEFVVANTLAKWKKLEPNEVKFSQGFSQKEASSCFTF